MDEAEHQYGRAPRYEPPAFVLMMELLRMLGTSGAVTVTITISAEQARIVAK